MEASTPSPEGRRRRHPSTCWRSRGSSDEAPFARGAAAPAQSAASGRGVTAAITGDRDQPDLFVEDHADGAIPVRLQRIRLERGRRFGDVWLGWTLWRALRIDEALTRLLPEGREAVPWATMAAVLVLARRGHSRDHRPDCKQVGLALVVTREGMPLGYEVFAGNRTDVTTVEEIVETMETRYGMAQRIW